MRRSAIWSALLTLEPVEFGRLPNAAFEDRTGAITTAACLAIPVMHKNQYVAAEEWLSSVRKEFGPEPGWLFRYSETLAYKRIGHPEGASHV